MMKLPINKEENQKTDNPLKRKKLFDRIPEPPKRDEMEDEDFEETEEDDNEEEEEFEDEKVTVPTNKTDKYQAAPDRQQMELELELKLRRLADIERQLKTKKISIKNDEQLTGIMSEQEMLGLAAALKFELNSLILYMKQTFKIEEKWFIDLFDEITKGEKSYEYWLFDTKK